MSFTRSVSAILLSMGLLLPAAARPQGDPPCDLPAEPPGVDNRESYQVFYEEDIVHPMELTADGSSLWVLNPPGARVEIFDLTTPSDPVLDGQVPVCMGPVSIRRRPMPAAEAIPATAQMWVTCQSSNSVFVIDVALRRVIAAIDALHEPSGLTFNDDGSRAYVTLSATNQVAEIDPANPSSTQLIEFHSPLPTSLAGNPLFWVHAEQPRAILYHDEGLDVLSFKSGNGSTRNPLPVQDIFHDIVNLWDSYPNNADFEPPDREVLRFDLADPSLGKAVAWRRGTLNFDLKRLADGRLLISTVDLKNDELIGEPEYVHKGFADHLITISPPSADGKPNLNALGSEEIDLNADLTGSLGEYSCATPTEIALSADEGTLWVACYESAATAIVDLSTKKVTGYLRTTPAPAPDQPFGPRGVVLHEGAGTVYVYNRGNNTLQTFPAAATIGAVDPLDIDDVGFDLTQDAIVAGRFHNTNAKNSASQQVSCNTCHMDGHLDGLAWDLGAFTGNVGNGPLDDDLFQDVAQDAKRLRVTMSLRGIEETNPLHWRGDRADLIDFNPAFEGLLGGQELTDKEFADFERFVFALSYPANPKQNLDRAYSDDALRGFECFTNVDAHDVTFDEFGTDQPVTCAQCHGMAGFSGTNNQVNNDVHFDTDEVDEFGFLVGGPLAEDATQLRQLCDKGSDLAVAALKDETGAEVAEIVPATGWGFGSVSFTNTDTVAAFVNLNVFDVHNSTQKADIVTFLDEFDSGSAPTTARAVELDPASPGLADALETGGRNGHNDLIVRGWQDVGGTVTHLSFLFDPNNDPLNYIPDSSNAAPLSRTDLDTIASGGQGQLFFVGVPVGTGYHLALDREMDFLLDGDEAGAGTSLLSADSDGDGYPDGYEVRFGTSPTSGTSFPTTDNAAPVISNAVVRWVNSTVAKVAWETDEESTSRIHVSIGGHRVWVGEDLQFKKKHVMVVRNLRPSPVGGPPSSYTIRIVAEDPANGAAQGNVSHFDLSVSPQEFFFQSTHITETRVRVTGSQSVTVSFKVVDENLDPVPGALVKFSLAQWDPTTSAPADVTDNHVAGPANAQGFASATVPTMAGPITVEAIARQVRDPARGLLYFNPLNGQFGFWDRISIP